MHRFLIFCALFVFSASAKASCDFAFDQNNPFFWTASIAILNETGMSLTNYQVFVGIEDAVLDSASISGFGQNTIAITGSDPYIIDVTRQAADPVEPDDSFILVVQGSGSPTPAVFTSLSGTICDSVVDDPVTRIRFTKELIPAQTWTKTFRYYVSPTNAAYSGSPGGDYVLVDALVSANGNIQNGETTDWIDVVPGTTIGIAEDSPGSTLGSATDVFYNCQDINGLLDQDEASMIGASRPFEAAAFSLDVPVTSMANDITCTVSNVRQLLLNIDDVEVVESDPGDDQNLVFTVSHNSLIPLPVDTIVTYSITDLTTDSADYTPPAVLSVTIPAGSLSTTLTIPVDEDLDNEADETFRIRLLTTTNGLTQGAVRDGIGTIINDDASLTIIKTITNDDGGSITDPDEFLLTVDDAVVASGAVTSVPANTALAINETVLAGYEFESMTGEGCPAELGGTITLDPGVSATCTITNNDVPPTLTALKTTSTGPDFAGSTASYTITVSNSSGVDAQNVVITDTPENAGFTYASSAVSLNDGATRPNVFDPSAGDNVMSWSSFTIPNGGSVEIEVIVDVASTVPAGVYDNSVNLITSNNGADINNYDGAAGTNTAEDVIIHQLSPLAGNLVINEVLYRATGAGAAGNDEFIELYNAGVTTIDLTGLMLIDGNLVTGDLDGTTGSITGDTMSFDFSCTDPDQICDGPTILPPGEYAVIWVGTQDLTTRDATGATFQAWLGQTQRLNNTAEDLWLFGPNNEFIDYVAWGSSASNSVNTDYPPSVWDTGVQTSLDGVPAGTSISLTPNGVDSDDSNCWEETLSADANGRCAAYLPTVDTDDSLSNRITSVGANNNGIASLTVEKVIVSDNGGTATLDDFDVSVDGTEVAWTDPASTTGGSEEVATIAGTYILSEGSVAGYNNGTWSCSDGTFTAPDQIEVAPGEDVVCTITNDDIGADLEIVKSVSNENPIVGETITFRLEVINNGPDDATNVVVDDMILAGFSFVLGSMTGGDSQNQTAPNLQWVINSLPNGSSVNLEYQVEVN